VISYEAFRAEVERRKRERWPAILASEPQGRAPGRRPRDSEKERLLLRLDRLRLEQRSRDASLRVRQDPRDGD
jgi:hypothetical protein